MRNGTVPISRSTCAPAVICATMLSRRWTIPTWRNMGRTKRHDWSGVPEENPPCPQISSILHEVVGVLPVHHQRGWGRTNWNSELLRPDLTQS
jgi:hypothetical protein